MNGPRLKRSCCRFNLFNPFNPFSAFDLLPAFLLALLTQAVASAAGFVYETPTEFLTSGDFNGDGILDVLVLDRATGNARVGYQNSSSNLVWSAPLPTGVPSPAALAVGHFRDTNQDAIAITAEELNRVYLLRLSNPSNAPSPAALTPHGLGPNFLAGLATPFGNVSSFDSLAVGSTGNSGDPGQTFVELFGFIADALTDYQLSVAQEGYLATGNSLILGSDHISYLAAILRGSNDTFAAFSPVNQLAPALSRPGLQSGAAYVFGKFNNETLPRFLFYVPGQSNIIVQPASGANGDYVINAGFSVSLNEAVQRVFYLSRGNDGVALLQFGDGVQGLTLPGGSPVLTSTYRSGGGSAGNTFTGIVPLANGNFVLLDGPPGTGTASHDQVVHFDGAAFTQVSAGNLPPLTTRSTRANVWLFQAEPFVSDAPGFISSLNAPDWSVTATNTSGALSALTASDGGPSLGLQNPSIANLGPAPAAAAWAMPDQYRDYISIFTYASPRPPEPANVSISPPPGLYGSPILVSLTTLNSSDTVSYRLGTNATYAIYTAKVRVTNDVTIQYYATNSSSGARSRLYTAAYSFGSAGTAPPLQPLDLAPGSTNPAPVFRTNQVILSDLGTVFYGRRSLQNVATIWAINLDGSGETYITTGARPRASRDGQWLAFLRDGNPFSNQGNLWVRNLPSGQETRLFVSNPNPLANTNTLICYDWDLTETNLVFDCDNLFWRISLDGSIQPFPISRSNNQGAPAVNPVDGRVSFMSLYPGAAALYVTPPDLSSAQLVLSYPSGPRWPSWSPDDECLAFADGAINPSVDGGRNLWVAEIISNNTAVFQITGFTDSTSGFPHGAQWTPAGDALVGAASIYGTNGIWVIPLNADCMCSDGPLRLLPTSAGDPIDFVGSIVAAPRPLSVVQPGLFIRLDPDAAVVYWSAAYLGFTLETTTDLSPPTAWAAVPGPYAFDGYFYSYRVPIASLLKRQFFRLHYTGAPM
jgi:hypothetical protein